MKTAFLFFTVHYLVENTLKHFDASILKFELEFFNYYNIYFKDNSICKWFKKIYKLCLLYTNNI